MCGILGYFGKSSEKTWPLKYKILSEIFKEAQIRGKDASGFSAINFNYDKFLTDKRNIKSENFIHRSKLWASTIKKHEPNIIIGHTRKTTTGDASKNRNNHPFHSNKWSLVHNGSVPEWKKIVDNLNLSTRTETDSEVLLKILEKEDDPKAAIQCIIDNVPLSARIAIAFINHNDKENKRLWLFRNENVPTALAHVSDWKSIFFASTESILRMGINGGYRNGSSHEFLKTYNGDIADTDPYTLYEFFINKDGVLDVEEEVFKKPKEKKVNTIAHRGSISRGDFTKTPKNVRAKSIKDKDDDVLADGNFTILDDEEEKGVSKETLNELKSIELSIVESAKIITSIQTQEFMSKEEWDHFQKHIYDKY